MYEYTIQKNKKLDWAVEAKIKELGLGIDADTYVLLLFTDGKYLFMSSRCNQGPFNVW